MPSSVQIRRLAKGDGALVRRLNALFADAFDDADAYRADAPDDAYCATVLAQEQVIALAAYGDDAAIALYEKLGVSQAVLHFDLAGR